MTASTRFAVAAHVLSLTDMLPDTPQSSEDLAASVGVHPVVIRNVSALLRRAGLLHTRQGVAGMVLARPASAITMLDVYLAVQPAEPLLALHERPNPACPVGANIQGALESVIGSAQAAMHARLASVTLADLVRDLHRRAG